MADEPASLAERDGGVDPVSPTAKGGGAHDPIAVREAALFRRVHSRELSSVGHPYQLRNYAEAMLGPKPVRVNELIARVSHLPLFWQIPFKRRFPSNRYHPQHRLLPSEGVDAARRWDMRAKRPALWIAALGFALIGSTGCQTWYGGMTLPSGRYLQHYPQYFAPDPQHPLPRELASQEDPEGAARRAGGFGVGPGPAPVAPIPPQPEPAPGVGGIPLGTGR